MPVGRNQLTRKVLTNECKQLLNMLQRYFCKANHDHLDCDNSDKENDDDDEKESNNDGAEMRLWQH